MISIKDIKRNIGATYYLRGVDYYSRRKVLEYQDRELFDDDDMQYTNIVSKVSGSRGSVYTQDIDIFMNLDTLELEIEGECSCPIGYNCKHVAAVCISYRTDVMTARIAKLNGRDIDSLSKVSLVDKWLINLQSATRPLKKVNDKVLSGDYFITFRLFDNSSYHSNILTFYKSKILKNGLISQGSELNNYNLSNYANQKLMSSIDKDIMIMSEVLDEKYRYESRGNSIIGSMGYTLMQDMVSTKRCFIDKSKEPLSFSNEIFKPKYEFKLYKGEYKLKSNIDEKTDVILNTEPLLIIDKAKNIVQEIEIDLAIYKQLQNAPTIEKKDIVKVYSAVGKSLKNIELKTPSAIKTKKVKSKAVPHLHLKYTKDEEEKSYTSFMVDFDYDGYRVGFEPQESIKSLYDEDAKVEIYRDLEFEKSVKLEVEEFGFRVDIVKNNLTVKLSDKDRQAQLKLWKGFLTKHIEILETKGWVVEYDEEFSLKFEPSTEVVVENEDENNWFSLSFNLEFNGVSQPIAPLVSSVINEFSDLENLPEYLNLEVDENHFVEVQASQIKPIIKTIVELFDKKDRDENLKISPYDAHLLEFMDDDVIWRGSKEILELSKKLKDFKGIDRANPPKCLSATLRDYQQEGLNWLNFLYEFKFGGILADDMGLGKTIQTLAHLSRLKEDNKLTSPSLVVMPTSLIANWKNEAKKFTPNLKVLSLHGNDRAERFDVIDEYDLLLTTYPLIVRDEKKFNKINFFYIILDEAQKIKNHKTKMAVALKTFKSQHRLALSGTPIENHLGELWSIFSFLMPGFLDTMSFFKNYYQTPIEKEHDFSRQALLNKRVKPFMIRRIKEKVAHELPAKSEIIKYTQFDNKQSKLYESIRVTMEERVREAVSTKGIGSSHITILDALLKLRQVCCDPSLLKLEEAQKLKESAKLELFLDLIDELLSEGRKILVFSQFTSMLAILEENIIKRKIRYTKLTGSTRKREEAIEKFTSGEADIFLISLKAGGIGLNLVEADTVIHYDPWWNPAVENQATDRAYRIGQTKAVFVYKLIVENTIEQKILEMQKRKQALQDGIYDNDKQQDDIKFSGDELLELLK
ncbi:MAG: DEAD/DEAH box helicase [Campylobacterota bacterium]|nr:DEAD/DEAH box helicase [Campylobacterota bacterium]